MVQTIFEADPHNSIYNDEFTEDLIAIENLLKSFSEKFNILLTYLLTYNSEKFPQELSCVINSDFVKIPSYYDRDKHIDLSLHFNTK